MVGEPVVGVFIIILIFFKPVHEFLPGPKFNSFTGDEL
jgi:hypothetical protein